MELIQKSLQKIGGEMAWFHGAIICMATGILLMYFFLFRLTGLLVSGELDIFFILIWLIFVLSSSGGFYWYGHRYLHTPSNLVFFKIIETTSSPIASVHLAQISWLNFFILPFSLQYGRVVKIVIQTTAGQTADLLILKEDANSILEYIKSIPNTGDKT